MNAGGMAKSWRMCYNVDCDIQESRPRCIWVSRHKTRNTMDKFNDLKIDVQGNTDKISILKYVDILWEYNAKINLVSRRMSSEGLEQLLNETFYLNEYISDRNDTVVDAGSGNGILGIPIAVINKKKKIVLVETRKKKIDFLEAVKNRLGLPNVEVAGVSIEEYLKKNGEIRRTLIARGFPDLGVFCDFVEKGFIEEAVVITSENKIKKNEKRLESVGKKIYNVSLRTYLKILIMEKKSREEKRM